MNEQAVSAVATPLSRLVLLSNSELFDNALRQYLQDCPDCQLNRHTTLRSERTDFQLALLDIGSFVHDECLRLLRLLGDTPIALVNAQPDQARRLIQLHPGIRGVFYPSTSRSNFTKGIRTMLAGGDWLPRALMEKLVQRYRQLAHCAQAIDDLTTREKQILALAGKGLSNSDIAENLHLSTHTIKSHIHNALRKLGATNRAQGASIVLAHVDEPTQ